MSSSYPESLDFVVHARQKRYQVVKWGNPISHGRLLDSDFDGKIMPMEVSFVRFDVTDVSMMDKIAEFLKRNLGHPYLYAIYDVIKDSEKSLYLLVVEKIECSLSDFFKQADGSIWQHSLAKGDLVLHPLYQKALRGVLEAFQSMDASRIKVINIDKDHIFLCKRDKKPKVLYAVAEVPKIQDPIVGDANWRVKVSKHNKQARVDPFETVKNEEFRPKLREMVRRLLDPTGLLQRNDVFFKDLMSDHHFDPLDNLIIHPFMMTSAEKLLQPIITELGIDSLNEEPWKSDACFNALAWTSNESWLSKIQNNYFFAPILDYSRQMVEKVPGFRGYDDSPSSMRKLSRNCTVHCNDPMTLEKVEGIPQKQTPADILRELRRLPYYLANGFIYARTYLRGFYAQIFRDA